MGCFSSKLAREDSPAANVQEPQKNEAAPSQAGGATADVPGEASLLKEEAASVTADQEQAQGHEAPDISPLAEQGKREGAGAEASPVAAPFPSPVAAPIDIDSILQDLEEEEEEEEIEKLDAMLREDDEQYLEGDEQHLDEEFLDEGAEGGGFLEESIFDPEFIQGAEEALRRERELGEAGLAEGLVGLEEEGGDVLFDPDLLVSMEDELRGSTPTRWAQKQDSWSPSATSAPGEADVAGMAELEEVEGGRGRDSTSSVSKEGTSSEVAGRTDSTAAGATELQHSLHLQRINSYKTAVESAVQPSASIEKSKCEKAAISPGVVARARESLERAQSGGREHAWKGDLIPEEKLARLGPRTKSSTRTGQEQGQGQGQQGRGLPSRNATLSLTAVVDQWVPKSGSHASNGEESWFDADSTLEHRDISSDFSDQAKTNGIPQDRNPDAHGKNSTEAAHPKGENGEKLLHQGVQELSENGGHQSLKVPALSESSRMLFSAYERRCPPGGEDSVVLYTTSLRAVRRAFEDGQRVKSILKGLGVLFNERDTMQPSVKSELSSLLLGTPVPPQLFIRGHHIGDGEAVAAMHEDHYLVELLEGMPRAGREACVGCGGKRVLVCRSCNGNHKVVGSEGVVSCGECSEEGMVPCLQC